MRLTSQAQVAAYRMQVRYEVVYCRQTNNVDSIKMPTIAKSMSYMQENAQIRCSAK